MRNRKERNIGDEKMVFQERWTTCKVTSILVCTAMLWRWHHCPAARICASNSSVGWSTPTLLHVLRSQISTCRQYCGSPLHTSPSISMHWWKRSNVDRHIEHHHGYLIAAVLLLRWVDGPSWNDLNKDCFFCDRIVGLITDIVKQMYGWSVVN